MSSGCPIIFHCEICFSVYLLSFLFSGQCLHLWCKPCLRGRWWKFSIERYPTASTTVRMTSPMSMFLQRPDPIHQTELNYRFHSLQWTIKDGILSNSYTGKPVITRLSGPPTLPHYNRYLVINKHMIKYIKCNAWDYTLYHTLPRVTFTFTLLLRIVKICV